MSENIKNIVTVIGVLIGIAGGTFGLGATIGKSEVKAQLDAHTQVGNIGHPEVAHRLDEAHTEQVQFREEMRSTANEARDAAQAARKAAQTAADESRTTRLFVQQRLGKPSAVVTSPIP